MRVLGVDPGGTTGLCLVTVEDGGIPVVEATFQVDTWHGLDNLLDLKPHVDMVVAEDFRLFSHKAGAQIGSQFIAAKVIGVLQYLCEQRALPLRLQPASDKVFFDNKKLVENGYIPSPYVHKTTEWRHAIDSIRHVLYWLHFEKQYPWMRV
jgi:hypothetical protein